MKQPTSVLFAIITMGIIAFTSCKADVDLNNISTDVNLNMRFAVPIGSASMSVADFLSGGSQEVEDFSNITTDEKGNLCITYTKELDRIVYKVAITEETNRIEERRYLSQVLDELWLPDVPLLVLTPNNPIELEFDFFLKLHGFNDVLNNSRIDSVKMKQAIFTTAFNVFDTDITADDIESVKIHFAPNNFKGINTEYNLENKAFNHTNEISLEDFMLVVLDNDGNFADSIGIQIQVVVNPKSNKTLNLQSAFEYKFAIDLLHYDVAYGSFQPMDLITFSDKLALFDNSAFDKLTNLSLPFADPCLFINVESNIGVPFEIEINSLASVDKAGQITSAVFENTHSFTINRPTVPHEFALTTIDINKANAGLDQLFVTIPNQLLWDITGAIAEGDDKHFMLEESSMKVDVGLRLPLCFEAIASATYQDTISLNLSEILKNTVEGVESNSFVTLSLDIENSLPCNMNLSFSFLDENGNPLELQLSNGNFKIKAATNIITSATGVSYHESIYSEPIQLTIEGSKIALLQKLNSIVYTASLDTPESEFGAQLLKTDLLKIAISLSTQLDVNLSIDSLSK